MRNRLIAVLVVAVFSITLAPGSIFAHHGNAAYDTNKTVTAKGTVTAFEFANPHVRLYWDVKDDKGIVEHWQAEMGPPAMLAHRGWNRNMLKVGDEITVTGHPAKNGSTSMTPQKIVLNGTELKLGGGGDDY